MNLEQYEVKASTGLIEFEFVSKGIKGSIIKVVQYSHTGIPNVYNLGFGDKDLKTGKIHDIVITNNGDSQKVLVTVANTVLKFIERYPGSQVFVLGSSQSRTRLYQIGISNNLSEITPYIQILGLHKDLWEPFEKGVNYEAFLIGRK